MAYLQNGVSNTVISDARSGNFANVTIQNAGSLVVDFAHTFQGTISGYLAGGRTAGQTYTSLIQKYPFASDTNATNSGNLSEGKYTVAGQSSDTHGYGSGGGGAPTPFTPFYRNTIDKFAFATDSNATNIASLTARTAAAAGQSSTTHGYVSGGDNSGNINTIQKFLFAADVSSTTVGVLTQARAYLTGQSSTVSGYSSGGLIPPQTNVIDKFPFSTDTNATDVGDLTAARWSVAGQSSTASGYTSNGYIPPASPTLQNTIDKFPFASDTNATDVGDLTQSRAASAGTSSTSSGYTAGGNIDPARSNTIDKFPFASDTNATDVGDLIIPAGNLGSVGQQD